MWGGTKFDKLHIIQYNEITSGKRRMGIIMKNLPSIKAILIAIIAISCVQFITNRIEKITVLQPTSAFTTLGNSILESVALKKNTESNNVSEFDFNELKSLKQEIEIVKLATSSPVVVYDGMTMEELIAKLNRNLSSDLSGYGSSFAKYSIEYGVDPYLAVAITLHETGCTWNCSYLVKACNNVGGMKGSGCGSYGSFASLDAGIEAMISNLSRNYIARGLTTAETIGPRYAMSSTWAGKINGYIERIKNN